MKKKTYVITISIITVLCIIWGSMHYIGGFMDGDYNFMGFFSNGKTKNISQDVEITEFSSINVESEIMDIEIQKGDKFSCHYECNKEKLKPKCSIEGGVLKIKQKGSSGFTLFSSGGKCKVTITVPDGKALSDIKIVSDTGDLKMADTVTESFTLESDTGDVVITNSNLGNTKIETDTGDITITASAMSDMKLNSDTGDMKVNDSTMAGVDIESDTGDISIKGGIKVASYNITMDSDTGDIKINGTDQGSKCSMSATDGDGLTMKITTDTGDITVSE